jgi:hypothetical protein
MAAALELEGKIAQKQPVQSGTSARGGWSKQEFVVEYMDGNFPSSAAFTAWGDERVKDLSRFQVGDAVKVSFAIKGREYNGRWYNDLQIWRISPAGAAAPTAPGAPAYPAQGAPSFPAQTGNPAPAAPTYEAPAPTLDDMPGEDSEDLPF